MGEVDWHEHHIERAVDHMWHIFMDRVRSGSVPAHEVFRELVVPVYRASVKEESGEQLTTPQRVLVCPLCLGDGEWENVATLITDTCPLCKGTGKPAPVA